MEQSTRQEAETFSVDFPLNDAVWKVFETSSLGSTVIRRDRAGLFGGIVSEFSPPSWPMSSGEKVLWDFCAAIAGQREVNLAALFGYHRNERTAKPIVELMALGLGKPLPGNQW
jgi:hypothetical protein